MNMHSNLLLLFLTTPAIFCDVATANGHGEDRAEVLSPGTRTNSRNATMVFGLGPGRTGTDSLRVALNELGFGPTYHMREMLFEDAGISTEGHMQQWTKAALGEEIDMQELLGKEWGGGVDFPLSAFPKELHAAFPDAKFILTKRPAKDWYRSIHSTICNFSTHKYPLKVLQYLPIEPHRRWTDQTIMMDAITKHKFSGNSWLELCASEEFAIRVHEEWNRQVEDGELVPLDQLLVFELGKHGYSELSEFLGVDEPSTPYPRVNSTKEMKGILRLMWCAMSLVVVLVVSFVGFLVFVIQRIVKHPTRCQNTNISASKKIE